MITKFDNCCVSVATQLNQEAVYDRVGAGRPTHETRADTLPHRNDLRRGRGAAGTRRTARQLHHPRRRTGVRLLFIAAARESRHRRGNRTSVHKLVI